MSILLAFLGILFLILLAFHYYKGKPDKNNPFDGKTELPYTRRAPLTPTELKVYDLLLDTLPNYMIFPQVQVSRVVESPKENNLYWFNFINRLSYDFVVCRLDGTPIAAIEIDDDTHALPQRQAADNRKDLATLAAGIAIFLWPVREIPDRQEIITQMQLIDKQAE